MMSYIAEFIAELFAVAKIWKQPKCPQTDEWIKKMWCVCVYLCVYVSLYIFTYMYISYLWILLGHEKEWNPAIGDSRDGTLWPCAKWDKSGRAHILKTFTILLSYCSWGSQDKNTGVVCHSFSSGPCFVRTLRYDPSILGGPVWHGL